MPFPDERKHLSADGLVRLVRNEFKKIPDQREGSRIALADALMAGYAVYALKCPSLLAFDDQRRRDAFNLRALFGMKDIPCDTQMRVVLDEVSPGQLRTPFTSVFRQLQRGKALEPFVFWEGHYLIAADGTTYHISEKVHCASCLVKRHRNQVLSYYHQMLSLVLIHPEQKVVIPLCPEPILNTDGSQKNDCERNATRRALEHFRREHPHMKAIFVEDALSANAPHIEDLRAYNIRFLLGVKPGSHEYLFKEMERAHEENRTQVLTLEDADGTLHHFRWLKDVAVNKTHPDVRVTMFDYWEIPAGSQQPKHHFTWITDLDVGEHSVYQLMLGGRSRWHIENETFNTLKNQGYGLDHNYGHGKKNLSVVFALLMMLAFLVDQTQQLCDSLFQAALNKERRKCRFWERLRELFHCFKLHSLRQLYELMLTFERVDPPATDLSG